MSNLSKLKKLYLVVGTTLKRTDKLRFLKRCLILRNMYNITLESTLTAKNYVHHIINDAKVSAVDFTSNLSYANTYRESYSLPELRSSLCLRNH